MTTQDRYNFVVANNRLSSYEERKAKHQANLAEAAKRNDNPNYQPKIDPTAYLQPEIVEGFMINADALPAGETVDIHLTAGGSEHVLRDFCPHYPYERIGRNIYEKTKAHPEVVSLVGGQVKRNGDGIPANAMSELGLHLPIWQDGVEYGPGTVVLRGGNRYIRLIVWEPGVTYEPGALVAYNGEVFLKLDDGDNTPPDRIPGGWEYLRPVSPVPPGECWDAV
jgi:hypothetical protein